MDMGLPYTSLIESLELQVEQGLFTAWSCAHQHGTLSAFFADEAAPPEWLLDQVVNDDTHAQKTQHWMPAFDLASLTKPLLANAWLRLKLGADQLIWSQSPLASLIEPRNPEGELIRKWAQAHPKISLVRLLNHTSGLQPWTWFGRALWQVSQDPNSGRARSMSRAADVIKDPSGRATAQAQLELTNHILNLPMRDVQSDEPATYSDLNYYLLARVIENLGVVEFRGWDGVLGELNDHWGSQFWHASMDPERSHQAIPFFPYLHSQVAAHVYENRKLENHVGEFGSVHDTNANILATDFRSSNKSAPFVSSHAGLFGSVLDVARVVPFFVSTQSDFCSLNLPSTNQNQRFIWGLDTPSNSLSTAGINQWPMPSTKKIFGHLGYTGTSMWMADDSQFHILLTNRTARRTVIGSNRVPRVLIFQKDSSTEPLCFFRWESKKQNSHHSTQWQALAWKDAYALCSEHSRSVTRYWDRFALRSPPDLAAVRRSTGQVLWSH